MTPQFHFSIKLGNLFRCLFVCFTGLGLVCSELRTGLHCLYWYFIYGKTSSHIYCLHSLADKNNSKWPSVTSDRNKQQAFTDQHLGTCKKQPKAVLSFYSVYLSLSILLTEKLLHHSPLWSNSRYKARRCFESLSCLKTGDELAHPKPDWMLCHWRKLQYQILVRFAAEYWIDYRHCHHIAPAQHSHLLVRASQQQPHMQMPSVELETGWFCVCVKG